MQKYFICLVHVHANLPGYNSQVQQALAALDVQKHFCLTAGYHFGTVSVLLTTIICFSNAPPHCSLPDDRQGIIFSLSHGFSDRAGLDHPLAYWDPHLIQQYAWLLTWEAALMQGPCLSKTP